MFEQFNCCPGWYIIAYLPLHIHFDSGPRWYIIAYLSLHIHFDGGPRWYIIAYLSLHISLYIYIHSVTQDTVSGSIVKMLKKLKCIKWGGNLPQEVYKVVLQPPPGCLYKVVGEPPRLFV